MNFDLKGDKLSYMRPVFRRRFVREETCEAIVPDAQPDILRILDTDGVVLMRSKDSEAGRVTVAGTAELTVLYVPESGAGVRKLSVSVPFSASADGADITADQLITARLTLSGADARTVNPRKVVVRAEITCEAELFSAESVYCTVQKEREGVYFKSEKCSMTLPAAVNEKTFIFTDEAHVPAGAADIGEILRNVCELKVESAKAVGSKAVVKGSAVTHMLYCGRDGGLYAESFTTPFSQIVDTDATGDIEDFDIRMCLTGLYMNLDRMSESGTEGLNIEIHAVAQCVTYRRSVLEFVTDAYSTKNPMTPVAAARELECMEGRETVNVPVTASVPVADTARETCAVSVRPGPCALRESEEGVVFTSIVNVSVIYRDAGGELMSAGRKTELRSVISGTADTAVELLPGEPVASVTDGSIEIRLPAELALVELRQANLSCIESVDIDEDTKLEPGDSPNLTVTRAGGGRDIWDLAKAYMSTPELIQKTNGLEGEPEEGTVLLIPRCV